MPQLSTVGKDVALWGSSANVEALLASARGSLIIYLVSFSAATFLGYRLVFALATLFLLADALFVLKIRVQADCEPLATCQATGGWVYGSERMRGCLSEALENLLSLSRRRSG
jgi:hypothetical protein